MSAEEVARARINKLTHLELEQFYESFKRFDSDGSGVIDLTELQQVLQWLGQDATLAEAKEMMEIADADGTGHIDFWEFTTLMVHKMSAGRGGVDQVMENAFHVVRRWESNRRSCARQPLSYPACCFC